MLKIYDSKDQIPEGLAEHYERSSTGKYEPKIEGINSVSGLIAKRDELLDKVREIGPLKTRVAELEMLETVPDGKIAVDKAEFDTLKASNDAYSALGTVDEIKPKVEGFDGLKAKDEARSREELYRTVAKSAGFANEDGFIRLAQIDNVDAVLKTVNENGKAIDKYFVKHTDDKGKVVETAVEDYVKTSPNFAPFADSLTAKGSTTTGGQKMIRQGNTNTPTATIDTEKEAAKASGAYSPF